MERTSDLRRSSDRKRGHLGYLALSLLVACAIAVSERALAAGATVAARSPWSGVAKAIYISPERSEGKGTVAGLATTTKVLDIPRRPARKPNSNVRFETENRSF